MAKKSPSVIIVTSVPKGHSGHSGYQLLAGYFTESEEITVVRHHPKSLIGRAFCRPFRKLAFTKWWVASGVSLEFKGILKSLRYPNATIVALWADHDLGMLDWFARIFRRSLIGVFHACPDDLPNLIPSGNRLKAFSRIVLMSKCQIPFFQEHGVAVEEISVILHGVDTTYFCPSQEIRSASDREREFRVLSVGTQRRDFEQLAKICKEVQDLHRVLFTVVGPPRLNDFFIGCNNVKVVSHISDDELLALYQASDAFIQTLTHATANNTVLEAMSCGLPVIATAVGGTEEYVPPDCGQLIRSDYVLDAITALQHWIENPGAFESARSNARSWAKSLDWEFVASRWKEMLIREN